MRIGEAAAAAGTTPRALRLYEARGLLRPPPRTSSGQREYDSAAVARVRVIRSLLTLGLTLEDLRSRAHRLDLLVQEGTPASCAGRPGELSDVVADRLAALDAEIARLTRLRQALAAAAGDVRDAPGQPPPDGQRAGRDPAVPARRSSG
ncbi:MerR family transcriptional regulator [Streptomyces sp. NRRL F-5727]|uniref:MerR family transcriptional regulator n=1 Tax=Streptomyces sp. NRRL F-5727 TaxID=1463871 RepID=UPI0007C8469C|nr:MerR family transcriptional regulator [Streptomyces sp. NRRL F-5727]